MTEAATQAPTCPGCHFGCSLDAYRCGRGKGFADKWRAGEPVPERGVPPMMRGKGGPGGPGGSGGSGGKGGPGGPGGKGGAGGPGGKGAPPAGMRVMHALNIMSNVLRDRHTESAERKVLGSIERQGGFFAVGMLGKRTFVEEPQLSEAIGSLTAEGLAELVDEPVAGQVLRITDAGRERQRAWSAEHDAATEEFLSPLSAKEQDQLADLLFRLIARTPAESSKPSQARPTPNV